MERSQSSDPITMDPEPVDWAYPPAIATVVINSHGDDMNGIIYISQGAGPHPTVVMLHGYPGDEKNLDLAQAIRRTGWNVLFFHYRGAWGSAGTLSVDHALEDVVSALDFLDLPASQRDYRVDPGRVALLGHSFGAYVALLSGAQLASVRRIAVMAPFNMGRWAYDHDQEAWAGMAADLEQGGHGAIHSDFNAEQFAAMRAHPELYDPLTQADKFDGKSVLVVEGSRDRDAPPAEHCEPLVRQLQERGRANLTRGSLDADHVFSSARIALARLIAGWLADTLA